MRQQQVLLADQEEKVSKALRGARQMHFFYMRERAKLEANDDQGINDNSNREPTDEELEQIETVYPDKDSKHYKAKVTFAI